MINRDTTVPKGKVFVPGKRSCRRLRPSTWLCTSPCHPVWVAGISAVRCGSSTAAGEHEEAVARTVPPR